MKDLLTEIAEGAVSQARSHPADMLARLVRVADAALVYFEGYCQDEAADDGPDLTGCSLEQHEAARELGEALADYSAAEVWSFVSECGRQAKAANIPPPNPVSHEGEA